MRPGYSIRSFPAAWHQLPTRDSRFQESSIAHSGAPVLLFDWPRSHVLPYCVQITLCRLFAVCMKACPTSMLSVFNLLPFIHDCSLREHLHRCFRIFAKSGATTSTPHPLTPARSSATSTSSSSALTRKRLHFRDPSAAATPEAKASPGSSLHPLFVLAELLPLSPVAGAPDERASATTSLVDAVHSLDLILRTCTGSSEEDPIAFKQLLSKLHKAIGVVLQLCREEVFASSHNACRPTYFVSDYFHATG